MSFILCILFDLFGTGREGFAALHCAASCEHSDCLETLVALCGAEVDLLDANGCTALFYAVTLGRADCAQLLLDCGANSNHQDQKTRTYVRPSSFKNQFQSFSSIFVFVFCFILVDPDLKSVRRIAAPPRGRRKRCGCWSSIKRISG
jgi:ankyrin repeat protein